MADLKDERGNTIYLTDQDGKPAQLVDEFGNTHNLLYLTGVATTAPHLKESSYTGPHPITAPITTTDTPHHAQPISVCHNPLQDHHIHSSEYDGQGGRATTNITDEINKPSTATVTRSSVSHEPHEKKGLFRKIKDKLFARNV